MRIYTLDAVINHEHIDFNRKFSSRTESIHYMFDYLEDNYIYNSQLEDEYAVGNKHNIHYVLNNANSFNVKSYRANA